MKLAARRASFIEDRQEMLDILERHFGSGQRERFEWRHIGNPAGESWTWFIYERDTKATVAMATLFPRRVFIDGKSYLCGQVGEFAVEASHRSLGPAVLMQRATFEPVDSGELAMCYDCPPHDQGMSTFVRLGMRANCQGFRYALPLRGDGYIERRLRKGPWTKPIVAAANLVLSARAMTARKSDVEVAELQGCFGEEFSHLDKLVGSSNSIRFIRSAALLNWRYLDNPLAEARVLVARRAGELVGFAVFVIDRGHAYVHDLFGLRLMETGSALLDAMIDVCRRERVGSVSGYYTEGNNLNSLFERFRFSRRAELVRVVAYEGSRTGAEKLLRSDLRWDFGHLELMV